MTHTAPSRYARFMNHAAARVLDAQGPIQLLTDTGRLPPDVQHCFSWRVLVQHKSAHFFITLTGLVMHDGLFVVETPGSKSAQYFFASLPTSLQVNARVNGASVEFHGQVLN